jgi:hypothetical protein
MHGIIDPLRLGSGVERGIDASPGGKRGPHSAGAQGCHLTAQLPWPLAYGTQHATRPAADAADNPHTDGCPGGLQRSSLGPGVEGRGPSGQRHIERPGEGGGIGLRREEAHGEERLVRGNAATRRLESGLPQRIGIDNAADKKVVLVLVRPLLRQEDRR